MNAQQVQRYARAFLDSFESHVRHSDAYQSIIHLDADDSDDATNDRNMLEVIHYLEGLVIKDEHTGSTP